MSSGGSDFLWDGLLGRCLTGRDGFTIIVIIISSSSISISSSNFIIIYVYVLVTRMIFCIYCLWVPEEGFESPGAGVTG